MTESKLDRLLRERREQREADARRAAEEAAANKHDEDLIPELPYERSEADKTIDSLIAGVDILSAYDRWCGKMRPVVRPGQKESIKVSCPNPAHPDKHPSAWLNTEKNTGNCATCGGFDPIHIAAWKFDFPVPGYKVGAEFHKLRERIAVDLGYTVTTIGGETFAIANEDASLESEKPADNTDDPNTGTPSDKSDTESDISDVSDIFDEDAPREKPDTPEPELADVEELFDASAATTIFMPELDWRKIVPKDSFLDKYMQCCTMNEAPEEYHFFSGLIAIGFALNRQVPLTQVGEPVYGNMFICLLGNTGEGKSISQKPLRDLLRKALPYSEDPGSLGAKLVSAPASAEALIKSFQKPLIDPVTMKPIPDRYEPVNGLVDFNELSSFIGRANRAGNVIKSTLMQFYDMDPYISTISLASGVKTAIDPYASLVTTTQPKAIRDNLTKSDDASGFLNRFVFVAGRRKKRDYTNVGTVDITSAVWPLQEIAGWAMSLAGSETMTWEQEALKIWDTFYHKYVEPFRYQERTAILVRLELLLMKIMMLLSANKHEKVISVETVNEALSCYDYLIKCYMIPVTELTNTIEEQVVGAIMHQLKRFGNKGVTVGALFKAIEHKKFPREKVLRVLKALEETEQIQKIASQTGVRGRPTVKYRKTG